MTFSGAITEAQIQTAAREERQLARHLRVHGIPERHDLGAQLAVREMFHTVSGAAFDRILREVRKSKS